MQLGDEVRRQHPATRPARGATRANAAVLVVATLVGVWLGWAAPSVSPAAPTAPAVESNAVDLDR